MTTHYSIEDYNITVGSTTEVGKYLFTAPSYVVGMAGDLLAPYAICDNELHVLTSGQATITEAQLDNWGTDNMYLINLIAVQAGVTLI